MRAAAQAPRVIACARVGELEHALAEALEVRVVGRAGDGALVVALHEHDRLPQRQRRVPAEVASSSGPSAPRSGRRARRACGKPSSRVTRAEARTCRRGGSLALDPHRAQVADVGERVADRRHLPVEDRNQPRRRLGANIVLPRRKSPWTTVAAAATRAGCAAASRPTRSTAVDLARAVVVPQAEEPAELALEVAGRLAEALEPGGLPVDRVELDERVDELLADPPALGRACRAAAGTSVGDDVALRRAPSRRTGAPMTASSSQTASTSGTRAWSRPARAARAPRAARRGRWAAAAGAAGGAARPPVAAAHDGRSRSSAPRRPARPRAAPAPSAVGVEEGHERLEHEQRHALVGGALLVGADDVVGREA